METRAWFTRNGDEPVEVKIATIAIEAVTNVDSKPTHFSRMSECDPMFVFPSREDAARAAIAYWEDQALSKKARAESDQERANAIHNRFLVTPA